MGDDEKELEILAIELYAAYFELEDASDEWSTLANALKKCWINVAKRVNKIAENVLADTLMTYGYNGKAEYDGLDKYINDPDHR